MVNVQKKKKNEKFIIYSRFIENYLGDKRLKGKNKTIEQQRTCVITQSRLKKSTVIAQDGPVCRKFRQSRPDLQCNIGGTGKLRCSA